jgi:hypothetical protein
MATMEKDFQPGNWWATISGAGTTASGLDEVSWADDYTRHRSGTLTFSGTTYSGVTDMYNHSGTNQPTDVYHGKRDGHTGRELDTAKLI